MQWLIVLIALCAGAANPFQASSNAELHRPWQQSLWAAAWVYASGLVGVLVAQAIFREPHPAVVQLRDTPWWAWCGGLIWIVATVAGLNLAQRLGSGLFSGLTITASMVVSLLLDHMGWMGMRQHTASPARLLGGVLMVAGVWLIARF